MIKIINQKLIKLNLFIKDFFPLYLVINLIINYLLFIFNILERYFQNHKIEKNKDEN